MEVLPGAAYPLGAAFDGDGTNFALFSESATEVVLCLFDAYHNETRITLTAMDEFVWHCYIPEVFPGQKYGYRVVGTYAPREGLRSNDSKILLDPYAKAMSGRVDWHPSLYAFNGRNIESYNHDDSAGHNMLGVVIDSDFEWGEEAPLRTSYEATVIYEAHVRGLTKLHPEVPTEQRGTFAGVAHPAVIKHLQSIGVTAVMLLPVQQFIHDKYLSDKGLVNYWGYNTIGYFSPHNAYGSRDDGQQVEDFKSMVRALHQAGIEVLLDIDFTHTAENDHAGPTLSMKGIDNRAYYSLVEDDNGHYVDYTGQGNRLNFKHPNTLRFFADCLRYWVTEMRVDGFRLHGSLSLAYSLSSDGQMSTFFELVQQDPVISQVKLIAEPWEVDPGNPAVDNLPLLWAELNGKYRDTLRDFWRGESPVRGEMASLISGSGQTARGPSSPQVSVNFVTGHEGFTLEDLVSYNIQHNEANGENNQDGEYHNRSWNCGVEGPTGDPGILALRSRQQRNLLASLLLSPGVPMLLHGDEMGRTQYGNNNAYCHDSELTWINWTHDSHELLRFVSMMSSIRSQHPAFRRQPRIDEHSFHSASPDSLHRPLWLTRDGKVMSPENSSEAIDHPIGVLIRDIGFLEDPNNQGQAVGDFLLYFNNADTAVEIELPSLEYSSTWSVLFDTSDWGAMGSNVEAGSFIRAAEYSFIVLQSLSTFPDQL